MDKDEKSSLRASQNRIELDESACSLSDELVWQFLENDPQFFIRQAKRFENYAIPHPIRGSVNLYDWQLARLRQKISTLESEIDALLTLSKNNHKLSDAFLSLQNQLFESKSLNDMLDRLNQWAVSLNLKEVQLYLFREKWDIPLLNIHYCYGLKQSDFELIKINRLCRKRTYLGELNETEWSILSPNQYKTGSVALVSLGRFGDLGFLLFRSQNRSHYHQSQGTELLEQIAEMVLLLIQKWVFRKVRVE